MEPDYGINLGILKRKAGCEHKVSISTQDNGCLAFTHEKKVKKLKPGDMGRAYITEVIDWIKGLHE